MFSNLRLWDEIPLGFLSVDVAEAPIAYIAYGKTRIPLRMDPKIADWKLIEPKYEAPLPDPHAEFVKAARAPIGSKPLREIAKPSEKVVIVTSDGTRPVPNKLLIPWILEDLGVPDSQVTIVLGTGTHRPNTPQEIEAMFGPEIPKRVRMVNHSAFDETQNKFMGTTSTGGRLWMDREWLEADKRIVVGFIEPHFFAGFSGGAKGVVPGIAGIETILHLHGYKLIADPNSAYGVLDGNPIQNDIQEMVAYCPPDFMVNVTLNSDKAITGFYLGNYQEAHRVGCARVKETAMSRVEAEFPIVVTSNSGFPLDQNLYQTVKGMSAAVRIAGKGGTIFVASECSDGLPSHGKFGSLLRGGNSPKEINDALRDAAAPTLDQWQAQILTNILMHCDVALLSALDAEAVAAAKLRAVVDLQAGIEAKIREIGPGARVAVMPDGPLTIPYVGA